MNINDFVKVSANERNATKRKEETAKRDAELAEYERERKEKLLASTRKKQMDQEEFEKRWAKLEAKAKALQAEMEEMQKFHTYLEEGETFSIIITPKEIMRGIWQHKKIWGERFQPASENKLDKIFKD